MRSLPGAFLVLGVVVVVVGTALAVAGYWPYHLARPPALGETPGEPQSSWSLRAKGLLSAGGLVHSERMKLLGPVVMGVGLFILICANTVLYENRDRETHMLLAQMRSVMCSVSAAVPSADLRDVGRFQCVSSLPAAHLHVLCAQQLARSEPLLSGGGACRQLVRAEALHHQESEAPASIPSDPLSSQPVDAPLPPQSCLVSTLGGGEEDAPAQLRRCHSVGYRTNPYAALCLEDERQPADGRTDGQTHGSWPRLHLASGRRYRELDNKEDSVDKLLNHLEQHGGHWDKSFGSGPFQ